MAAAQTTTIMQMTRRHGLRFADMEEEARETKEFNRL